MPENFSLYFSIKGEIKLDFSKKALLKKKNKKYRYFFANRLAINE